MATIELTRMDDAYHMAATNERGNVLHLDNNVESGGQGAGFGCAILIGRSGWM